MFRVTHPACSPGCTIHAPTCCLQCSAALCALAHSLRTLFSCSSFLGVLCIHCLAACLPGWLQYLYQGQWLTATDYNRDREPTWSYTFDWVAATVACRALGYVGGLASFELLFPEPGTKCMRFTQWFRARCSIDLPVPQQCTQYMDINAACQHPILLRCSPSQGAPRMILLEVCATITCRCWATRQTCERAGCRSYARMASGGRPCVWTPNLCHVASHQAASKAGTQSGNR